MSDEDLRDLTVTGAAGVVSTIPGEDEHDGSIAGAEPEGEADESMPDDAPAREWMDESGDSMGDDDVFPTAGAPAGETDSDGPEE